MTSRAASNSGAHAIAGFMSRRQSRIFWTVFLAMCGHALHAHATPGTGSKAITTWDGSGQDRDVSLVFGSVGSVFAMIAAVGSRATKTPCSLRASKVDLTDITISLY